jgi:hypothetical protein
MVIIEITVFQHEYHYSPPKRDKHTTTEKPQFQYHSHTHQVLAQTNSV